MKSKLDEKMENSKIIPIDQPSSSLKFEEKEKNSKKMKVKEFVMKTGDAEDSKEGEP